MGSCSLYRRNGKIVSEANSGIKGLKYSFLTKLLDHRKALTNKETLTPKIGDTMECYDRRWQAQSGFRVIYGAFGAAPQATLDET
jgi:hypothetical protein